LSHCRRYAWLAILCVATAGCSSASRVPDDELRLMQLAQSVDQRGDSASAVALYERAARLSPDSRGIQLALGNARLKQGDMQGATAAFRDVLTHHPDDAEGLLGLGTAALQSGEPHRAARLLAQAAPKIGSANAYNRWGVAAAFAGDFEVSAKAFEQAAALAPENLDIRTNAALAWALLGDHDRAVTHIAQVTRSPLAQSRHSRQEALIRMLAGDPTGAQRALADLPADQRQTLLTSARAIQDIADPSARAKAMGLMARQSD